MPIYAYRCESCGYAKDVLQKMSDAPLTDCPQCGAASFRKQVTAAGFQLKGSGWYVTDFRNNGGSGSDASKSVPAPADGAAAKPAEATTAAPAKSDSTSAAPAPAPAASSTTPSSGTS